MGSAVDDEEAEVESIDKLVAALDWAGCCRVLDVTTVEGITEVAEAFAACDHLVSRYPNERMKKKRDAFVVQLNGALDALDLSDLKCGIAARIEKGQLLESCFHELLETLPKTAPGRLDPRVHVWGLIERLAADDLAVESDSKKFLSRAKGGIDPTTVMVKDGAGREYRPDSALSAYSDVTASSITMLALQNKWMANDGRILLPPPVPVSERDIYAVGLTQYLGHAFGMIGTVTERWRFWGGEVTSSIELVDAGDSEREMRVVRYAPEFESAELLDHVATERLNRYILGILMELDATASVRGLAEQGSAKLPPDNFISREEAFAAVVLHELLHFDVLQDPTTYGGLTFAEWLRGYSWLQRRSSRNPQPLEHVVADHALAELVEVGLSEKKARTFVDQVSLHKGRTDLFDTPLIAIDDGTFVYHPHLFQSANVPRILISRLAGLSVSIAPKGKAFETEAIATFTKAGRKPISFKFKRDDKEYEYDAMFLWDRKLFIFECKSYSLPMLHPLQLHWYVNKMGRAMRQVRRLADAASRYPEEIRTRLGKDAEWDEVVPCVLNSLPWSAGLQDTGVYVLDHSLVRRYLETKTNFIRIPLQIGNTKILVRHHVKQMWPDSGPTAELFMREMKLPWQIKSIGTGFEIKESIAQLSGSSFFVVPTIRHAPPNLAESLAAVGIPDPTKDLKKLQSEFDRLRTSVEAGDASRKSPKRSKTTNAPAGSTSSSSSARRLRKKPRNRKPSKRKT